MNEGFEHLPDPNDPEGESRLASLLVVRGHDRGRRFRLDRSSVKIGRGVACQIRLFDTEVSRAHAELSYQRGWQIRDLSSSNGTLVNGRPVTESPLRNGDQLLIGGTAMVFMLPSDQTQAERAAERVSFIAPESGADHSRIVSFIDSADSRISGPDRVRSETDDLRVLYDVLEDIVRPTLDLDELLHHVLEQAVAATGADRGCILLHDGATGDVQPRAFTTRARNTAESDAVEPLPVSRTIVDYVLATRQGVQSTDAQHDRRFEAGQSILRAGVREALCVPMQSRSHLVGVLYVDCLTPAADYDRTRAKSRFAASSLPLLVAIGRQAALAVLNSQIQQSLVQSERLAAMGQTVAILSHHIKNVLQGIRGGSYLVERGLNNEDFAIIRQGWGLLERNQSRIYNLVMDMLTFSKDRAPTLQPGHLDDLSEEVCELMQGRAAAAGVQLFHQASEDIPLALFDEEGLHRAILNVITNAIDAAHQVTGGTVTVSTVFNVAARRLEVAVADNGPGIDPDVADRLFKPFESTKGSSGTGLGLAVSQKILREHDGDIHVSTTPGEGTTFVLWLPYFRPDGEATLPTADGAAEVAPTAAGKSESAEAGRNLDRTNIPRGMDRSSSSPPDDDRPPVPAE